MCNFRCFMLQRQQRLCEELRQAEAPFAVLGLVELNLSPPAGGYYPELGLYEMFKAGESFKTAQLAHAQHIFLQRKQ